ncbi:hypothetical protein N7474_005009 [Penicillium riverlandense]|uniref:uncharacterized protein n=1 Tax=Penicillium riverlandense TaxID=1903569 RepID=UPI00254846F0|nr:uncharacterized protein N7474_005009 [Penicillium riverlandense]KAJ5819418.1 hypothetical protein N7474_005009 [Penicillium riverlandense]
MEDLAHRIRDISTQDKTSFPYIFEQNVSIPLKTTAILDASAVIRCNIYRPNDESSIYPVLVTYGPYGKDIHYRDFHGRSFAEVNPNQQSEHSCWETPDPLYWTQHGYVVVRADERGTGQSPGMLDTMSRGTSEAFFDVVEWCAEQAWSSGHVGLLGISYYAGSQWRVAARRPKGLKAIVPWEGMSDYYRDRCRHGGIFANGFIDFWYNRQVVTNQYGRPGRAASNWGPDTIEGELSDDQLEQLRRHQTLDNASNQFRDDVYYASKEYALEDIEVPLLSVANWGGITVHLRGNVQGFLHAGSELKYIRFITGRHDLPFYRDEEVELQRSFLDAFLRDDDRVGWSRKGEVPPVDLVLRKGNVPCNDEAAEMTFPRRTENEWPLARTEYTKYYLTPDYGLQPIKPSSTSPYAKLSYKAPGPLKDPHFLQFTSLAFERETEVTGHIVAHLCVSLEADFDSESPRDIDLFVTLRHISPEGQEINYTGSAGDPVPACRGWLRVSLRKVNENHPRHRSWLPYREYLSTDILPVLPGEVYSVDVELWPTSVVVGKGGKLVLEVASGDTEGSGIFQHNHPRDRPLERFQGVNSLRFGPVWENYVTFPIIPPA